MAAFRRFRRGSEQDSEKEERISREGLAAFGRLLRYVRPFSKWMVVAAISLIFSTILGLILPLVIGQLVDGVLVESSQNLTQLNRLVGGLLLVFAVQAVFSFVNRLTLAYVGEKVIAAIRIEIYSHLQRLSLRFFADRRTGEIVSRLTNDVTLLQEAITNSLISLLRQAITLLGAAAFLFYLNTRLTLVIIVGIPVISLVIVSLGRRIRAESKTVQDKLAEAANVLEETTSGVRIVKSFAREGHEIGRFSDRVNETYAAAMRRAKIQAVLAPLIGFMAFASITFTLWFGSLEVVQGRLSVGDLVAYLVYTMMVASPVATLAGLYAQFQSAIGATERLFELLDTKPDIADAPNAVPLPSVQGAVSFKDVSFDYSSAVSVLHNVDFAAQPGQVVALVGPSGAGKSTLVNLIPRFYDINEGGVEIDGHDVREVQLHSLREQIGIVPQETILFSDSVAANIKYGRLDATEEEVKTAARAANAHDFITHDLPDGYATLVGERGVKLSGGQRQRVAIARAILKDPRILILDEATSSLDSESEKLVQEALDRLMAGRTSFVIAHRLSTIINADWILVLEEGRVVEQGTHSQLLLNSDGLYTRLYQMQFER